jgi:hypothetical protein
VPTHWGDGWGPRNASGAPRGRKTTVPPGKSGSNMTDALIRLKRSASNAESVSTLTKQLKGLSRCWTAHNWGARSSFVVEEDSVVYNPINTYTLGEAA